MNCLRKNMTGRGRNIERQVGSGCIFKDNVLNLKYSVYDILSALHHEFFGVARH